MIAEKKKEKVGVVYLMINHSYVRVEGAQTPSLATAPHSLDSSMNMGESRISVHGLSKLEARKWIYEEFKPVKVQKLVLSDLNDYEKESYLKVQNSNINMLRDQRRNLKGQLDVLEDRLDEVWHNFKERNKKTGGPTEEELRHREEIKPEVVKLNHLQKTVKSLKMEFNGNSGFDVLKGLENTIRLKTKNVKHLEAQILSMNSKVDSTEKSIQNMEKSNREEVESLIFRARLSQENCIK